MCHSPTDSSGRGLRGLNRPRRDCSVDQELSIIQRRYQMKKYLIIAAVLLGSSSAAYAAGPEQVANIAMACCDLVLACCEEAKDCCS
jgi:hypothetical protein